MMKAKTWIMLHKNDAEIKTGIRIVCVVGLLAYMAATLFVPVFADTKDFSVGYRESVNEVFKLLQGLFGVTACLVILINLFLMLVATDDKGISGGIHRIKIAIVCVIGAYLVPLIVTKIALSAKANGSSNLTDVPLGDGGGY
jgi:hypothetical protein